MDTVTTTARAQALALIARDASRVVAGAGVAAAISATYGRAGGAD